MKSARARRLPLPAPRALAAVALGVAALLAPSGALPAPPRDAPSPAGLPAPEPAPGEPPADLTPRAAALEEAPPATPRLLEEPDGVLAGTWLDLPHAFLERRIFGIVNAFDRFFADEGDLGTGRSTSFVRWRNEARLLEDGTFEYGTSVRADLTFPYLQRRLRRFRILLENAGRRAAGGEPAAIAGQGDGGRADALLRLTLLDTLRSSIDVGGGVLFDLPPGAVGRVRFRRAQELGRLALARVATTGFWNTVDGFGANGSLGLERALGSPFLLRWTTGTLVSESSAGWESASELALLATLGRRSGLTLLGSVSSASRPRLLVTRYRAATRLRTALYRDWIFAEIEPELAWPLDAAGDRIRTWSVLFRLEIQFTEPPPSNS